MTTKFRTKKEAIKALGKISQGIGPNGRGLCRYCGQEVPPRRRSFCGTACVHEWKVRADWGYAKRCVRRRDRGICTICGLDCIQLQREIRSLPSDRRKIIAEEYGIPKHRIMKKLYDIDHIIPVSEGGVEDGIENGKLVRIPGGCSLANLRLLCIPCHIICTDELKQRLALKRRLNKRKIAERLVTNYKNNKG